MVSDLKLKRKLPGLLIDVNTGGNDAAYQRKRNQLSRLQRREPAAYNSLLFNLKSTLDELDRAAEQVGFQHIDFDTKGNLIRKSKFFP